ncbi:MAG: AEC family transporter [Ruminococcaceae bacterium]|nr:AEC family transporter [Oscillospiraceae bacterium]
MLSTFLSALSPMLMLFTCIGAGYALRRSDILSKESSQVIAKLETWLFVPALSFTTMSAYCTAESLKTHFVNMLFACFVALISVSIAIFLARFFTKKPSPERGIYQYALAFGNQGFMGEPVVLAIFGATALSYFKFYTIPLGIVIYTWGISVLVPDGENGGNLLKKIFNFPTIATLAGILAGTLGLTKYIPTFLMSSLNSLGSCMGPLAMVLAGVTVANYSLPSMLKNKKVYIASLLRLIVIPSFIVAAVWGLKELINLLFALNINNLVVYLALFASAMPLGLNTIVFPEAYGGNPETGASMALISHTLCVITIPIMFAVMSIFLGDFPAL